MLIDSLIGSMLSYVVIVAIMSCKFFQWGYSQRPAANSNNNEDKTHAD